MNIKFKLNPEFSPVTCDRPQLEAKFLISGYLRWIPFLY